LALSEQMEANLRRRAEEAEEAEAEEEAEERS